MQGRFSVCPSPHPAKLCPRPKATSEPAGSALLRGAHLRDQVQNKASRDWSGETLVSTSPAPEGIQGQGEGLACSDLGQVPILRGQGEQALKRELPCSKCPWKGDSFAWLGRGQRIHSLMPQVKASQDPLATSDGPQITLRALPLSCQGLGSREAGIPRAGPASQKTAPMGLAGPSGSV